MTTNIDDRVTMLEQELAQLRAELAKRNADGTEPPAAASIAAPAPEAPVGASDRQGRPSRRRFFKAGAAVVAGAAVATPLLATPAGAADNGNMIIAGNNTGAAGNTRLVATAGAPLANVNIMTVSDSATSSTFEAALGGYAQGVRVFNAMYAFTNVRQDADTATGHAIVVRAEAGSRSHLLLTPSSGDPRFDSYAHRRGEVRSDGSGRLWFCTDSGTPGTWRKLAGVDSSGALHAIAPTRVYDSRFGDGRLARDADRLVSVANGIDITSGAVNVFNVVPSGATAIMFNLTVVSTVGGGFLAATPGNAATFRASSINWFGANQVLANGTMSTVDTNRQLRIWCGNGAAHFIIDVTAYML